MNPGLQAREFRIIGGGRISETNKKPEFFSKKIKEGTVRQRREANEYIVSGLFSTSEAASKFVGKEVVSASGVRGEIKVSLSPSEVSVKFKEPVSEGEKVCLYFYKRLRSE
jgi:hypothetical protein